MGLTPTSTARGPGSTVFLDDLPMTDTGAGDVVWVRATDEHELAGVGRNLVCRNANGKQLKSVPKAAKETQVAEDLTALREWLERHAAECEATISNWVLGSLPVPVGATSSVWPDPAWQAPLRDAVVVGVDAAGTWLAARTGFLRVSIPTVGSVSSIWTASRSGSPSSRSSSRIRCCSRTSTTSAKFAVELGIEQVLPQLQRQTFTRPADLDPATTSITDFANGHFAELRHVTGRGELARVPCAGRLRHEPLLRGRTGGRGAVLDRIRRTGRRGVDRRPRVGRRRRAVAHARRRRPCRVHLEGVRMASTIHAGRIVEDVEA